MPSCNDNYYVGENTHENRMEEKLNQILEQLQNSANGCRNSYPEYDRPVVPAHAPTQSDESIIIDEVRRRTARIIEEERQVILENKSLKEENELLKQIINKYRIYLINMIGYDPIKYD